MSSKFTSMSLRDAGISLIDCVHKTPAEAHDGNFKYIAIPQMKDCRIDDRGARRISEQDFIDWTKKALPKENDVILSRRCNPGETAFVPRGVNWALGQNLVLLRSDGTKVYPPYLRWLVRSEEWWEQVRKFINVGAIFESLKCADVPNFQVSIPPLDYQRKIARVLDSIENKIELNLQTNETLESLAKTIFKEWFIDFGPVKAKAEGRRPFGIEDTTASLFPDTFEDSEMGKIPKGWRVCKFKDIVQLKRNSLKPGSDLIDRKYAPIDEIPMKRLVFANSAPIEEAQSSLIGFEIGDILFGAMRPYFHRVCLSSFKGVTRTTVFVLNPNNQILRHFALLYLNQPESVEFANQNTSGSTIPYAVWENGLCNLPICLPDEKLLTVFEEQISSLTKLATFNCFENQTLAQTRDQLLPKLTSGELDLK